MMLLAILIKVCFCCFNTRNNKSYINKIVFYLIFKGHFVVHHYHILPYLVDFFSF